MLAISMTTLSRRMLDRFSRWGVKDSKELGKAMSKVGLLVQGQAKDYAPKSPTKAQGGGANANPGGLERSIQFNRVRNDAVDVFVPTNSEAGTYAKKMHDLKGIAWLNRGAGTKAKGPQADDKFIKRAIDDQSKEIEQLIENGMRAALKGV